MLRNLSLLFIPAAVGVVQYLDLLRANAAAIGLTIALSTVAAMIVTVVTFRFVSRLHAFRHKTILGDITSAAGQEDRR